jgi:hypothetical protein
MAGFRPVGGGVVQTVPLEDKKQLRFEAHVHGEHLEVTVDYFDGEKWAQVTRTKSAHNLAAIERAASLVLSFVEEEHG